MPEDMTNARHTCLEVRLDVRDPELGVLVVVAPLQAEAGLWLVMVDSSIRI